MDNRPIGVFDSGVGGLTVVKELIEQLPNENIVYFGDTARVPYGTKSPETVTKFSFQNIRFLMTQNIKAIVIACNTASAHSLNAVQGKFDIPIIGVVEPGSISAVKRTRNNKIGIIGTQGTISSKAYETALKKINPDIKTFGVACPLFVPLAEEGWLDNEIAYKTAEVYLESLNGHGVDTIILGCTHYPLLSNTIGKVVGDKIELVNPALETAKEVKDILTESNSLRQDAQSPTYRYYLSDIETKFEKVANICLNKRINHMQKVDIDQY